MRSASTDRGIAPNEGIGAIMSVGQLFAGSNQPAHRSFDITGVQIDDVYVRVATRHLVASPFCRLAEFTRSDASALPNVLVVAPLSGHFPILLRDLVVGLIPFFRVYITDWTNVRHVAMEHGCFGLDSNISHVQGAMRRLGPGLTVIALCQGGVPALAATALLAAGKHSQAPSALVLMAAPINPLANPTRVVGLLRSHSLSWLESNVMASVAESSAGKGRRIYPAHLQLGALWTYLTRRASEGGELRKKLLHDDGSDPACFPFLDLYTSIMDLDAKFFLENTERLYRSCALFEGTLRCHGQPVDLRAIRQTALLTVEGEFDDIAAPGQTSAAHQICTSLPARLRQQMVVPGSGHFSLFHGRIWRRDVLPAIREFCAVGGHVQKTDDTRGRRVVV